MNSAHEVVNLDARADVSGQSSLQGCIDQDPSHTVLKGADDSKERMKSVAGVDRV